MFHAVKRIFILAAGVLSLLFCGLIYGWSIFVAPLEAEFGWARTETSLTFTISIVCFVLGTLTAGFLSKKIAPRFLMRASAVLLLTGFFLAARVTTLFGFYCAYGVCCGLGVGLSYNVLMNVVNKWFPDKPGLISGLLLLGYGCGGMVLGGAATLLMASMGWRSTFQLFAFAFFAIILAASMLMKLPSAEDLLSFQKRPGKSPAQDPVDVSTREMFRKNSFWLYYFWSSILPIGGLVLVGSAAPIAGELGADLGTAAIAAGAISVANGLGRVLIGAVYDRRGHRLSMLLCSLMELCSIVLLFFAYRAQGALALALCFASLILMGLSFGGNPTVNSAFVLSFYGRSDYSAHLSILSTTLLASSFIGPPVAANIMASTGSYAGCIPFLLVFAVLSLPPALLVKKE